MKRTEQKKNKYNMLPENSGIFNAFKNAVMSVRFFDVSYVISTQAGMYGSLHSTAFYQSHACSTVLLNRTHVIEFL
jgi:hypothetical protein